MRHILKLALFVALFSSSTSISNADIVFSLSPGSGGATTLEIMGTGTVTATGGANLIAGIFANDPFDPASTSFEFADLTGVGITLGGQNLTGITLLGTIGLIDLAGPNPVPIGTPLSDLDGVFSFNDPNFDLSSFVPGQYQFISGTNGSDDVGVVTFNIAAVPEPATGSVLLFSLTALAAVRRRKSLLL